MLPPSRTTRRPWRCGRQRRRFSFLFALATTAASFLWFEYLAQPLNRRWLIATSPELFRTQIGPQSRIQPRSVGATQNSTASRLAPDFFKMERTRACVSRFSTSKKTRSTLDRWRTISAKAQGIGANFPGQSVSSCGQPSQVASCGSHSAGMRKPRACGVLTDGSVFIGRKNLTQRSQRAQRAHRKQKRKKQRKGRTKERTLRIRGARRRARYLSPSQRFRIG